MKLKFTKSAQVEGGLPFKDRTRLRGAAYDYLSLCLFFSTCQQRLSSALLGFVLLGQTALSRKSSSLAGDGHSSREQSICQVLTVQPELTRFHRVSFEPKNVLSVSVELTSSQTQLIGQSLMSVGNIPTQIAALLWRARSYRTPPNNGGTIDACSQMPKISGR